MLFAAEGAKVVLGDVLTAECRATADSVNAVHPESAVAVDLDVTDADAWAAAVDAAVSGFGGLHVLINNAGIASATGDRPRCASSPSTPGRR